MNSVLPLPEVQQNSFTLHVYGTEGHENKRSVYIPFVYSQQEDLKSRVDDLHVFIKILAIANKRNHSSLKIPAMTQSFDTKKEKKKPNPNPHSTLNEFLF